ncbi:MAG: hypothetical protein KGL37_01685 [Acidobacteriota bacterium]|nr:hypothetical protein [Acidobacteriota bacterium]
MDDLPELFDRLQTRLEALERRVFALEHPAPEESSAPLAPELKADSAAPVAAMLPDVQAGGMFSVLGKAMLGIAGAYVLRAVAESTSLPKLAVAALAVAYATMWLVWAARLQAGKWLASTIYASTSALILAPMLWELTLRFKVLPPAMTAAVLLAFVCSASALAWKRELAPLFWVANLAAATVALSLSIASRAMEPFVAVLLLMVLICEYAAGLERELGVRSMVAMAADLAIWILLYVYISPQETRADYPILGTSALLAPAFALLLIFVASVVFRTVVKRKRITVFETVQIMIAFLLAACVLVAFGPPASRAILGVSCLVLAGTSYAAAFVFFDRLPERRNYGVFTSWSAALFLAGSVLCLSPQWQTLCLGAAAIMATALGARLSRRVLEFHGMVYLLAAAEASGLARYVLHALIGAMPAAPAWEVYFVAVCAVLCSAVVKPARGEPRTQQALQIVFASLAAAGAAALLVQGLVGLFALSMHPAPHHLAFIRTLTICAAALALAFGGSHWSRRELTRIGYAALAFVAAKLVFEDLYLGQLEYIAAAIFLFAITLISVPGIVRMGRKAQPAAESSRGELSGLSSEERKVSAAPEIPSAAENPERRASRPSRSSDQR